MVKKSKTGMSTKLAGILKKANGKFKKASAAGGGFENPNVSDGKFEALIPAAYLKEIGGKGAVVFEFKIEDEEAEGEIVSSRYFLETEQNLSYLKRDLGKFIDDIEEFDLAESLEDTLAEISEAGYRVEITVKNGEYQNVYLGKVLSAGDADDEEEEDEEEDEPKKGKKKSGAAGGKPTKGKKSKEEDDEEEDDEEEEEEDDSEEEEAEIEEGMEVLFQPPRAKKPKRYTVLSVKGGKATLEDEDGETLKGVLVDRLEVVDAEADDEEDEEDEEEEEEKSTKGKKGKPAKGKKSEEDDEEEDDSEEAEIEIGSKVAVQVKGKEFTGKVVSFDEDEETVEVKYKDGAKSVTKTFPADKIELLA